MTAKELFIDTQYEFETQARTKENKKTITDVEKKLEEAKRKPAFQLELSQKINDVVRYYFERRGFTVLVSDNTTSFTWDNPTEISSAQI